MPNPRALALALLLLSSSNGPLLADSSWTVEMPWREAGLSERQAAAHLLGRLTYGPRPGDVDAVVEMGLGNWFEGQLAGDLPGPVLAAELSRLPALALSPRDIVLRYSNYRYALAMKAINAGVITREDYTGKNGERRLRQALAALDRFAADRGMRERKQLTQQLRAQKLLRAVYSHSQLVEVLTAFWFNHFNVSIDGAGVHVLSYERDAVRPHVLTTFRQLLGATARHPAMLAYLDNASSVAPPRATTTFDLEIRELDRLSPLDDPTARRELARRLGWKKRRTGGINENYARELLELHTLGLDGGYRQRDVVEVARAFTGWTTFPRGGARTRLESLLARGDTAEVAAAMGFVVDGEFLFRADRHDSGAKRVLGVPLAAGRGIEDGEEVLDLIARHPATARRLAAKLAARFVSEQPGEALVQRLVQAWELTGGDLRELLRTIVESPEFWQQATLRSRTRSPFELAVSALRALDAELTDPAPTLRWIHRMGEPLYAYAAPTGFPDRAASWLQVGPLLSRLNFAHELARGKVRGITLDLLGLLGQRRLASLEEAVAVFFPRLMPERDPTLVLDLIGAPTPEREAPRDAGAVSEERALAATRRHAVQAVAILIGSPEFQVH